MSAASRHRTTAIDVLPGWYGKVSSLGDFAHRRLSPSWVASCDRWLSAALVDSRAELGASWLDTYLTAPVLRFVWAPDAIDERWWFGVLMASCDNVGRYFPLVIAQSRESPPLDGAALDHLERWYAGVANAALLTLSDADGSLEAMEAALVQLPAWPAGSSPGRGTDGDEAVSPIGGVLGRWTAERRAVCTAWWAIAEGESPRIVEIDGLPDGERFGQLLAMAVSH